MTALANGVRTTLGNAIQAGIGQGPGRHAVVGSTLPHTLPPMVNEASGSGLRAVATLWRRR